MIAEIVRPNGRVKPVLQILPVSLGVLDVVEAKGDLIAGIGALQASRLAVGNNGYVLVADSAQDTGLKWASRAPFVVGWSVGGTNTPGASTAYAGIGSANQTTTAALANFKVQFNCTVKNLNTYVGTNGSTLGGNTVTIFDNGSASSLLVTYGAGSVGWQSNTADSFELAAGEHLSVRIVHAGSAFDGALRVDSLSVEIVPS